MGQWHASPFGAYSLNRSSANGGHFYAENGHFGHLSAIFSKTV